MIGGGDLGGADPFQMLNLVQQQQGGPSNFFQALSEDARQAVMRAREASAGTTPTDAVGTDHLLAGVVTGDSVATEALRRAQHEMARGRDSRYRHPYYWAPFVVIGGHART